MQRIAVTGAGGFIGSALVRRVASEGRSPVVALTRTAGQSPVANVTYRSTGDLAGRPALGSLLKGVDVVVHCAARVHIRQRGKSDALDLFQRVNVEGSLWLAQQAASVGVRRIIYMSSIGVHGASSLPGRPFRATDKAAPHNAYAKSKWNAEEALRKFEKAGHIEVVVIRPPLVYGPGAPGNFGRLKRIIDRGIVLPLGSVTNSRSLVALDNLLDLTMTCLEHPAAAGQSFLVSDGRDLSTPEVIQLIATAMHRPVRLIPVPVPLLRLGCRMIGARKWIEQLLDSLQVDIQHTRDVLGWEPPVSIGDAFKRAVGAG